MADSVLPEMSPLLVPEGWDIEFCKPPIAPDDAVKVSLPDGRYWWFLKNGDIGAQMGPFVYALLAQVATLGQSLQAAQDTLGKMQGGKRLDAATVRQLHKFLDCAAGEGLDLDGVDAAELYIAIFPEKYNARS